MTGEAPSNLPIYNSKYLTYIKIARGTGGETGGGGGGGGGSSEVRLVPVSASVPQWADRHEWGGTSLARGSAGYLSLPPSRSPVAYLPGIHFSPKCYQ